MQSLAMRDVPIKVFSAALKMTPTKPGCDSWEQELSQVAKLWVENKITGGGIFSTGAAGDSNGGN